MLLESLTCAALAGVYCVHLLRALRACQDLESHVGEGVRCCPGVRGGEQLLAKRHDMLESMMCAIMLMLEVSKHIDLAAVAQLCLHTLVDRN